MSEGKRPVGVISFLADGIGSESSGDNRRGRSKEKVLTFWWKLHDFMKNADYFWKF